MSGSDKASRGPAKPFACNLAALDDEQRLRRSRLAEIIRTNAIQVVERPNGYIVFLGSDHKVAQSARELVDLERKCCPFLGLTVGRDEVRGEAVLEITADPEAKVFIATEIGILGARG